MSTMARIFAIAASGFFAVASFQPAQAETTDAYSFTPERHCLFLVEGISSGEEESRILSYECHTDKDSARQAQQASSGTHLMTWYSGQNFQGSSYRIQGTSGPCDRSGYGFSNVGSVWNNRISSFKTYNRCNSVSGYDGFNYARDIYVCVACGSSSGYSEPYVGNVANNRISSLKMWNNWH
ncbi:hypothetical protein [Nocardiopsis sp. YSL2]|uniref:hypothetical protein n=1 Tax=Nocardiopsis sp. YSL2 TaxID=2939492 RepID=UPI0026F47C8F|nr:hypothetical protein [Nocardiopsis sp. YSL2]